jgi:hypothetical protein
MNIRFISRLAIFALLILVLTSILTAAAASNTVPSTRLTNQTKPITANDIKPPQCAAFNLTGIFVCPKNNCRAPGPDLLVIGIPTTKKINGGGGNSCCVGDPGISYSNCAWNP